MARIALVLPRYRSPARPGSASAFAVSLAQMLVDDHDVDLICAHNSGLPPVGVRALVTGGDGLGFGGLGRFVMESERLLRRGDYKLIVGLGPCRLADISRMDFIPARLQRPNSGRRSLLWLSERIEAVQFGTGRCAVAVSPMGLEYARHAWPALSLSRYIPDAPPLDLLLPPPPLPPLPPQSPSPRERAAARQGFGLLPRDTVLLTTAHDPLADETPLLLDALSQLPDHFALLVLCDTEFGSPDLPLARFAALRRLARKMHVADRLVFAPASLDLLPFFHAADIFVLPGHGQSLAVNALAARVAGLRVLLDSQDGVAPLLAPLDGVSLLAQPTARDLTKALLALSLQPAPSLIDPSTLTWNCPSGAHAWKPLLDHVLDLA